MQNHPSVDDSSRSLNRRDLLWFPRDFLFLLRLYGLSRRECFDSRFRGIVHPPSLPRRPFGSKPWSYMTLQHNLGVATASILIQATLFLILLSRISKSPLLDSTRHVNSSIYTRLQDISFATYLLWMCFVTGWIFSVTALLLQVGMDFRKQISCEIIFFSCAYLYGLAKVPIYLYLIERAHVVRNKRRRHDMMYCLNMCLLALFGVIFAFPPERMSTPNPCSIMLTVLLR